MTQCACWETCTNETDDDSDMCWECRIDGCPGGRTDDDTD